MALTELTAWEAIAGITRMRFVEKPFGAIKLATIVAEVLDDSSEHREVITTGEWRTPNGGLLACRHSVTHNGPGEAARAACEARGRQEMVGASSTE